MRVFVFISWLMLAVVSVEAQVVVERSNKKVTEQGVKYYLHTVKKGETLYAICKAYEVSQRDVIYVNPSAMEGVKVGEELRIPVGEVSKTGNLETPEFIYHIAEEGHTVYYICKKYNITTDELYKHNPDLKISALQVGQVVTIPRIDAPTVVSRVEEIKHTVQPKETLFSIARLYNLSLNQLLDLNPELDANSLTIRIGQQLVVARKGANGEVVGGFDELENPQETEPSPTERPVRMADFRIGVLLPFGVNSTLAPSKDAEYQREAATGLNRNADGFYKISDYSKYAIDYYLGMLLALEDLKRSGLSAKVLVYECNSDTAQLRQTLQTPLMEDLDIVFGPFNSNGIALMEDFCKKNDVYCVSPTARNAGAMKDNPYYCMLNSGEIHSVPFVVKNLKARQDSMRNMHITLVRNMRDRDTTLFYAYKNLLYQEFPHSMITVKNLDISNMGRGVHLIQNYGKQNCVIAPTEEETFVNLFLSCLTAESTRNKIYVYGMEKWTRYDNLDYNYLHALNFSFATLHWVDYKNPDIEKFLKRYREKYGTEPSPYMSLGRSSMFAYQTAYLGYDVTRYFGEMLKRRGRKLWGDSVDYQPLQTPMSFQRVGEEGGYMNVGFNIYRYTKDYNIVKD